MVTLQRSVIALAVLMAVTGAARAQSPDQDKTAAARAKPLPAWLTPGTVRFARFDGGPLEVEKAKRSAWGAGFSAEDLKILGDLYGGNGDRMIELLQQANVNFVWVTYSVGFSWKDEEGQRAAVREIVRKLHAHNIKVAAYVCASTVFWESMFKDVPQSVKWIMFDEKGVPYRFSEGRDALRFIADIDHADWVEYQKRRIGAIIDDGLDAIFLDNTNVDFHTDSESSIARFCDRIFDYARREKKSDIPFFTNLGLRTRLSSLNRRMEIVYDEGWAEPGAWGDHWEVSNVRRDRFVQGLNPDEKPFLTEYSLFRKGDRNDSFLAPRSQKLAVAEAAAFGASYTWDMEGPFVTALVSGRPAGQESWAAISQYNRFLAEQGSLYARAVNVTPWLVLLPASIDPDFDWQGGVPRLDFFAKNSVLCRFRVADGVTQQELSRYQGVVVPSYSALAPEHRALLRDYQKRGGKVSMLAEATAATGLNDRLAGESRDGAESEAAAEARAASQIYALAPEATHLELRSSSRVLGNVTLADGQSRLVVHMINYDQAPAGELKLTLRLGKDFAKFAGHRPTLLSPDSQAATLRDVRWNGSTLEATLSSLDTYSVVVVQ